jgi:hypothetical protein
MCNLENMRNIGLVLGGLLAVLAASFVSKPASSEGWTYQLDNSDGWGGIRRTPAGNPPMRVTSRLFPTNDDCAAAKLDVWLDRGILTYTLFKPGNPGTAQRADTVDVPGRTTMLIGEKACRIRVVIERADDPSGSK